MTPLGIGRIIFLVLISVFSSATAGLAGYLMSFFISEDGTAAGTGFLAFSLACGVITVVLIGVVRVCDWTMTDSWLSRTAVEVGWLGFLWVLWMANAGYTTSLLSPLDLSSCTSAICSSAEALEALPWLCWLLCATLFTWELVFAIVVHNRGYPGIWMAHASRHVMGMGGKVAPAKYASVGTNDYGMEQMRAYDAPFRPPQGQQPYAPGQGQPQQQSMYSQPQWGQSYAPYGQGPQDPYAAPNPAHAHKPQSTYTSAPPQQQQQQQQQPRSAYGQPRQSQAASAPSQGQYGQVQGMHAPPPGAMAAQNPYAARGQGYYGRAEV